AEQRVCAERAAYGYAWRSLRTQGSTLALNSDMAGSDPDIFYGLHAAITRRNKDRMPPQGWFAEQALSPEEALRGYTTWNAYAMFAEDKTAMIAPGRWADLTVMNIDPLQVGEQQPGRLLDGRILMTIVAGKVAYETSGLLGGGRRLHDEATQPGAVGAEHIAQHGEKHTHGR
ncbi:MAG: amidohydrolase family protein, partial [Myxococcota bacterium]